MTHFKKLNLRQRRHALLRVEELEGRLVPATDIQVQSFIGTNGGANVALTYTIVGDAAPAFTMDFFKSADNQWDTADALIKSIAIQNAADLTPGPHFKAVPVGAGAAKVPLPGAGPPDVSVYLLAVADSQDLVPENDVTPQLEDNTAVFSGVYHIPGGPVVAHTGEAGDMIKITRTPNGLKHFLDVNGQVFAYTSTDMTRFSLHTHGGADVIVGNQSNEGIQAWTGADDDYLFGGRSDDQLNGGSGNDYLTGNNGNDNLYGEGGNDILVTSLGRDNLRPGGDADQIVWTRLVNAAASMAVTVSFTAFIAGAGAVAGEGAGTLNINVKGNGKITSAGTLPGSFTATGNGAGSDGTCTATYSGTANGALNGPLSAVRIRGTAFGRYVVRCPDGIDRGEENETFRGIASLTGDSITVQVSGNGFGGSGVGAFGLVTTSTIG